MKELFFNAIQNPIFSVLQYIYNTIGVHDLGISIIVLTILIRVVLLPIFYKGAKDQSLMQKLQPKIKEIQKKHKENKEEQARVLLELYKEHKVNPFSGFALLIVQLPVFIALFQIFAHQALGSVFDSHLFLGLINLEVKNIYLAVFAAGIQYLQSKMMLPKQTNKGEKGGPMESIGKTMVFIGPVFTVIILMNLPAALGLYWTVSNIFSVIQQFYINKKTKSI